MYRINKDRCTERAYARPKSNDILFADAEPLDNASITANVFLLQVVQQSTPLADHFQQAATRMMVLAVGLEMLGQVGDPSRKECDLHLGRARVVIVGPVAPNDL